MNLRYGGRMKKLSKLIIGLWLLIALLPTAQAVTPYTNCSNGVYTELYYNGSSVIHNNTYTCATGDCADNGLECDVPADTNIFFPIGVAFSIIAFILAYLAYKVDENHAPLQIIFLISSILHMVFVTYLISGFALLTLNTLNQAIFAGYNLSIWTLVFVFFYFMYTLVKEILEKIGDAKKRGRPFKFF